jgi:hypothetical protein
VETGKKELSTGEILRAKQHAAEFKAIVEAAKKLKEAMEKSADPISMVVVTHTDVNLYKGAGWHTLRAGGD